MHFGFSTVQDDLRDVARRYLAKTYPPAVVAAAADSGPGTDPAGWPTAIDLSWLDDELGMVELAVLADELGYALAPLPWWSTVGLARPALDVDGPPVPATLAWYEQPGDSLAGAGARATCRALRNGRGWRLSGRKRLVTDLGTADEVVVTAATGDGVALFAVDPREPGTQVVPLASLDGLRRVSDLAFTEVPGRLLHSAEATPGVLQVVRRRALALLAAEAVGVARRAVDIAADHARVRLQFGRPIGSYQGVAFRVADGYAAAETAGSLAYRAAWLVGRASGGAGEDVEVDLAVSSALVAAREAAVLACEHAIQVLGGIGMTWEHPLHRWYRRALWCRSFDVGDVAHREHIATALLGAAS